jgi:hypothetical protein
VTHSWFTLPYQLGQYQYGVPATLTVQANAVPHRPLTPQQALDYKAQSLTHGAGETLSRFLLRLEYRARYYRFFFLPPLYVAGTAFLFTLRDIRSAFVAGTLVIFAIGTNLFPYLLVHYLAAVTCLSLLVSVLGLEWLSGLKIRDMAAGGSAAGLLIFLCVVHFLFWYGVHLFEHGPVPPEIMRYETWDNINHTNPERRITIDAQLAAIPGKRLVFVRYWPQHVFQDEWVWNEADIDGSRVVWARDLGALENQKLISYYPGRKILLLEPDARPPVLSAYIP